MKSNLPIYVATDGLLQDLHDLGYKKSIELADLLDLYDDEIDIVEDIVPGLPVFDELSYVTPNVAKILYGLRT